MKGARRLRSLGANWKLKLAAFALALMLWVFVSADKVTSAWISTPVEIQLRDLDWELAGESVPGEVQVRFSGPGRELWELALEKPRLVLRISSVERPTQLYGLDPAMVSVPGGLSGVRALDVRPGSLRLSFERVASKEVPVRIAISRGPRVSYVLRDSLGIEPATVKISGPAPAVARVQSIITRPIDLSGRDSAFVLRARFDLSSAPGVRVSPDAVEVSGIIERVVERTLADVPIAAPPGTRIEPASIELRLNGTRRALQAVDSTAIGATLVLDSLPEPIPPGGIVVPLRPRGVPKEVRATLAPNSVRIFPAADTSTQVRPAASGEAP